MCILQLDEEQFNSNRIHIFKRKLAPPKPSLRLRLREKIAYTQKYTYVTKIMSNFARYSQFQNYIYFLFS